eukprot:5293300-Pyramimonas_sp.AAC.1
MSWRMPCMCSEGPHSGRSKNAIAVTAYVNTVVVIVATIVCATTVVVCVITVVAPCRRRR